MSAKAVRTTDQTQDSTAAKRPSEPLYWYQEICASGGGTCEQLLTMPQHYPGGVSYLGDTKFTPISAGNFGSYINLGRDDDFTYAIDSQHTTCFVFANADIERKPKLGMVPVMRGQLRDTIIKGYKQVYHLRIRKAFSRKNVATSWYLAYVNTVGGIVSDFEHLEGGMRLWRSFVRTTAERGLRISLVDTLSGEWKTVGEDTPYETIWSKDKSKKPLVLVLEKAAGA